VRQHVEEVAFFGVDHPLHFGHLISAEALLRERLQEFGAGIGSTPEET